MREGERRTLGVALTAAGIGAMLCLGVVLLGGGVSRAALRSKVSCDGAPRAAAAACCRSRVCSPRSV